MMFHGLSQFIRHPRAVIALCVALSIIPLLSPAIPPLTDLFGHIGRYRVQLDVANDPVLQRYYAFHWALIGNLGVDALVQIMAPLIGLEPAVKLIVIAIVGLTVSGFLVLARTVHGRIGPAALFALPLAYSYPFHFGFVNYCLSMALALLAFALWLRLGQQGRIGLRAVLFAGIAVIVWLTHISGWGALGLFAFAAEAVRMRQQQKGLIVAIIQGGLHCAPLTLPVALMVISRSSGAEGGTADWFDWMSKYQWFMMALSDRWQGFDVASIMILLWVIGVAAVLRVLRFDPTLGLAAVLLFAAFLIMPRILIGSAYADMRFAPYILALALLAIEARPGTSRWLRPTMLAAGLAFFLVRTAATTESFRRTDALLTAELGALDHIPGGARVASFISGACGAEWMLERRNHLPSIALARRRIFTNDQFIMAGAQLLGVHYGAASPFDRDPSQLVSGDRCVRPDWLTFSRSMEILPRAAFDYVWVIGAPDDRGVDYSGLIPVWRNGSSTLFRIDQRYRRK